jgi:hypothetical protein
VLLASNGVVELGVHRGFRGLAAYGGEEGCGQVTRLVSYRVSAIPLGLRAPQYGSIRSGSCECGCLGSILLIVVLFLVDCVLLDCVLLVHL